MVRLCAALVCVSLGNGFAPAAEVPLPSERPTEMALAAKKLEAVVEKLRATLRKFDFVCAASEAQLDENQRKLVLVKLADCVADVTKSRDALRLVVVDLRLLALKCAAERDDWRAEWLTNLADRIQRITGDKEPKAAPFPQVTVTLNAIRDSLEKGDVPKPELFWTTNEGVALAAREVTSAFHEADETLSKERLVEMLRVILANQERIRSGIRMPPPSSPPDGPPNIPKIGERLRVVLEKGGRVGLQHTINWGHYKEDELEITVTASDPSLVVPQKLKLEFEKHQFRFEYEIKAGNKAGDFTVTLKPASGNEVTVGVTVK